VQQRLARLAGSEAVNTPPAVRRAAARTNLELYLCAEAARSMEGAVIFEALDTFGGVSLPRPDRC
jgi:hypothetical protein